MTFTDEIMELRRNMVKRRNELQDEVFQIKIKEASLSHELKRVETTIAELDPLTALHDAQNYLRGLKGTANKEET